MNFIFHIAISRIILFLIETLKENSSTQVQDLQDMLKEKESELSEVSKSLSEIKSCYHATEQDLKSLRQDKSNLEEELEEVKRYVNSWWCCNFTEILKCVVHTRNFVKLQHVLYMKLIF